MKQEYNKNPIYRVLYLFIGFYRFVGTLTFDRFYKGDMGLGFAKMAMWAFIFIGLVGFFDSSSMLVVWIFNIVALFIWNILDFFLVWQGIKNDNLAKIIQFLEQDNENFISNKQ
ncbi:hypothetical protein RMD03_001834 [Campylobacter coli]|nr:hypothetical protein [Campylobacter coli]ELE3014912.1 hypothetical protein [Campylobacter coli]